MMTEAVVAVYDSGADASLCEGKLRLGIDPASLHGLDVVQQKPDTMAIDSSHRSFGQGICDRLRRFEFSTGRRQCSMCEFPDLIGGRAEYVLAFPLLFLRCFEPHAATSCAFLIHRVPCCVRPRIGRSASISRAHRPTPRDARP